MQLQPSKVAIALSGGVDSSVAAALLKEQGWEVRGVHLTLPAAPDKVTARRSSVEKVARHLQIPLDLIDLGQLFTQAVIDPFLQAYLHGLTPNPCVQCNETIKFAQLLRYADQTGTEYIATGHYALIERKSAQDVELWRGKDFTKDQSYFLHRLSRSQLARTLFPLGSQTKQETRAWARRLKLSTVDEPESQEICFLPDNDYRTYLIARLGRERVQPGEIKDPEGRVLGRHNGTFGYTIGQRHGLGIASPLPYYVKEIRPQENLVIAARKEELFSTRVEAHDFNWLVPEPARKTLQAAAQIRYRHKAAQGRLEILAPGKVVFEFEEPQWAVTPGQALVVYQSDQLLGGGWIDVF